MCMHYIKKVRFFIAFMSKKITTTSVSLISYSNQIVFLCSTSPPYDHGQPTTMQSPDALCLPPYNTCQTHTYTVLLVLCTYIQKYIVHMNLPLGSSLLLGLSEEWSSSTAEFSVTWKMSPISVCEVLPSALFCSWWICSICKCFMVRTWPIRAGLPGLENLQSVQLYALFSSSMEASIFCRWVNRTAAAWCCWFATCTCNLWGLEE